MSRKLSDPSMDENASKKARYEAGETKNIKGTVVLMKKKFLDLTDAKDAVVDQIDEILGHKISLQLISAVNTDPGNKGRGELGKPAFLEGWKFSTLTEREAIFSVNFEWNEEIGVPGAFLIKNSHHNEFYLKTLTLDDVPGHGKVYFVCNSWIYHSEYYKKDRVFFANQEFPPTSKLEQELFGEQRSTISENHVKDNLDGLSIHQAIKDKRLFILDHHDSLIPYLKRINTTTTQTYASRTLLFLKEDGLLKPLAIELTREDEKSRIVSKVYTPAESGAEAAIWQLAKAYVAVNDSGFHQLVSHWLHTHAVTEPFIIATNRQLSVLHPIYKLLHPHFRDTMYINALARQILINADGILEMTVFPGKFSLEMSATIYKDWNFAQQALPADLIKRGMAVEDSSQPHGIKLVIEDYPYAVDGLEIWSAIKTWVRDYCNFYYKTDEMVQKDTELQSWWKEVQEKGHGDKKDEPWWPKMQTREELIDCCTIIIWIASALHAAINFGQYPYGGYPPNRPSMSRRFMPEPETSDYEELKSNPEKAFLKTITPLPQSIIGISLIEALSLHTSDEVFLGTRAPEWTTDEEPLQAFERFGKKLEEIEQKIVKMNKDPNLKNRVGPANIPYTLLCPSSELGLTGRGIPNSVSV